MDFTFFGLLHHPFSDTADLALLFASQRYTTALQALIGSLKTGKTLVTLLGEPGVGKTFLLHTALTHRDLQPFKMVYVFYYPQLSLHNILQLMCREFGLNVASYDLAQMTHAVYQALLAEHARGRQVVLVIDEAHTIPITILDILVRLTTLSTSTGDPLLQIVLAGLPALWQHCHAPPLRPFTKGKVTRVTLTPLTYPESVTYIRHRLHQAGAVDSPVFARGAMRHMARYARGIPRVMNVLCTNMLTAGFEARQKPISAHMARKVLTAYRATSFHARWAWGVTVAAGLLVVAGMVGMFPSGYQTVSERTLWGLRQFTPSLLAVSGMDTAQQPVESVSPPAVPVLSAPSTSIVAVSPPPAPAEMPTPAP